MNKFCNVIVVFFLYLAVFSAAVSEEKCTLHQLQSCLESWQSLTQGSELVLGTRRELIYVCNILKDGVWCVDDHMKLCFSSIQRKVFNHVVEGARQFLSELCEPGPTQEAYLRHSSCYKNISQLEKCAQQYQHLISFSTKVDERENVEDDIRQSCCAFNAFVQCKYDHITRDCGADSGVFLRKHLESISTPLLDDHCAHYTHASNACSTATSLSELTSMSWVGYFSCIMVFRRWLERR